MTIYSQISQNKLRTYIIVGVFVVLLTAIFYFLGVFFEDPNTYLLAGLVVSTVAVVGSYFFSDKIVLATVKAQPAKKEDYFDYYTVAENLSIAAGLPMPTLYVIDDPAPNAFATGRDPGHAVICATTGLLNKLDRAEIEGVVAHELSHVKNYDMRLMTIVAVLVGTIVLVADWVMRSRGWGGSSGDRKKSKAGGLMYVLFLLVLIIGPIAARLMKLALSRKREFLADASGALLTRYPEGLAQALEKIAQDQNVLRTATTSTAHLFFANPLKKADIHSRLGALFQTHPPIEDRIRILREM